MAETEGPEGPRRGRRRRSRPRPRPRPRKKTRGGGRPRARRPRFGQTWWARRWLEVLEGVQVGRRLGRGRSYMRQGNVVELELDKGSVTALVQGSRDAPYLVRMRFAMLPDSDWRRVVKALGEQEAFSNRLLVGEMPEDVEDVFGELGLSLFPTNEGDLRTACSCPDKAIPCKHIAAVYYLLGEEFDRDPFLIFRLRGMERGDLLEALGKGRDARAPVEAPQPPPEGEAADARRRDAERRTERAAEPSEPEPPLAEDEPLPSDPDAFWGGHEDLPEDDSEVRVPSLPAALARRLGGFPFFRGEEDCMRALERVYGSASVRGIEVCLGEALGAERGAD